MCLGRFRIRFLVKKPDTVFCTANAGKFLIFYIINILDNSKSFLFCLHTFCARRSVHVIDPETSLDHDPVKNSDRNRAPGSGFFGQQPDPKPCLKGFQRSVLSASTDNNRTDAFIFIISMILKCYNFFFIILTLLLLLKTRIFIKMLASC